MSQWTHVNGAIRYDRLRGLTELNDLDEIKKLLGNTVEWNSSEYEWKNCNVPIGSEGSIQYHILENPDKSAVAAFNILIFGDLRDFGRKEVDTIKEWFEKVTINQEVRNAIIEVNVEFGPTLIFRHTRSNKTERIEITEVINK